MTCFPFNFSHSYKRNLILPAFEVKPKLTRVIHSQNWTTLLFNDPIVRSMLPPASSSYGQVIEADPSISGIFHTSMATKGSVACALSSVITVLSSMAYYDQFTQFATSASTEQVYFAAVLYPRSAKGLAALVTLCLTI